MIKIHWDSLKIGGSFFIPCINVTKAESQVKAAALKKNMKVFTKITVENGMYGLRVWRTEW